MNRLIKIILVGVISVFVLGILIFISQILSARSSLEQKRLSIISTLNSDTARLAVYRKTPEYKRVFLTQSKDSLDMFLNNYINSIR